MSSYSSASYLHSYGSHRKNNGSYNEYDIYNSNDKSLPRKDSILKNKYNSFEVREEEERDELKDSIQRRLGSLKKQLGLDEEITEDEKYISKMNRIAKRIDESMEKKDVSNISRTKSNLENTFGTTKKDDTYLSEINKYSTKKADREDSFVKGDEKRDFLTRQEHERILEAELKKLENRFFGLFEFERKELNEKLSREREVMEKEIRRDYEDKILQMEMKTKQLDSIMRENEELRREIRECQRREELTNEENHKLREMSTQRRAQTEALIEQEEFKEREMELLNKIEELEGHKRKLLNDIQDYKNDLNTLKEDIQKDEEIYSKCLDKLKKYKTKNLKLTQRIAELEGQTHHSAVRPVHVEDNNTVIHHSNRKKSRVSERSGEKRERSKRSRKVSPDEEEMNLSALQKKDEQLKDLKHEIRLLLDEISDLKQRNLELNHRNIELESELKGTGIRRETFEGEKKDNELMFWKDRCETLVRKYLGVLRTLKEDNERMKKDLKREVLEARDEATAIIKRVKKQYKKKLSEMEDRVSVYKEKYMEYLTHKNPRESTQQRSKSVKGKTLKK